MVAQDGAGQALHGGSLKWGRMGATNSAGKPAVAIPAPVWTLPCTQKPAFAAGGTSLDAPLSAATGTLRRKASRRPQHDTLYSKSNASPWVPSCQRNRRGFPFAFAFQRTGNESMSPGFHHGNPRPAKRPFTLVAWVSPRDGTKVSAMSWSCPVHPQKGWAPAAGRRRDDSWFHETQYNVKGWPPTGTMKRMGHLQRAPGLALKVRAAPGSGQGARPS